MFPILSPAEYRRLLTTPLLLEEYSPVGEHAGLVVSGRLDSWGPAAMPSCHGFAEFATNSGSVPTGRDALSMASMTRLASNFAFVEPTTSFSIATISELASARRRNFPVLLVTELLGIPSS